ncbi:MAG: hypothetical protein E7440_00470 [Ruminococcaceae bacterium]|nr:hypothetical protein [Oscillospiraceae bacterium]
MGDRFRTGGSPVVGLSSLLTIFGVLCLTVFALLTVSTAQAGARLGHRAEQAVQDYYAADRRAEELLAALRSGEMPEGVTGQGSILQYSCAVGDTQMLTVEVAVQGADYRILRWQTVPAGIWQAEDRITVWGGK